MTEAQIHIDGLHADKALAIGELRPGPTLTDKLTGKLVIKNYPNITRINLVDHELTELEIINCPNLEAIDVGVNKLKMLSFGKTKTHNDTDTGTPIDNKLNDIRCPTNLIERLSFKNCPNLERLLCQENPLHWLDSIENLKLLRAINLPNIRLLHAEKLGYYKDVVKAVRETLGIDPNESLPKNPTTHKLIIDTLKERIKSAVVIQIEKEGGGFKVERGEIVKELGLTENSTTKQILDKIKELMNRPASAEVAQKDSKITDLEQQLAAEKQKNADLQKQINDSVTHEIIAGKIENSLENLGISSAAKTEEINNASSAEEAIEIGNRFLEKGWKQERDAKKQAFYLNIALISLLALALLALTWIIMKGNKLPINEEDEKKIKK